MAKTLEDVFPNYLTQVGPLEWFFREELDDEFKEEMVNNLLKRTDASFGNEWRDKPIPDRIAYLRSQCWEDLRFMFMEDSQLVYVIQHCNDAIELAIEITEDRRP